MPIYEFECLSCGKRFDRLQKMSDPDPTDCPVCGPAEIKRAFDPKLLLNPGKKVPLPG